MAKDVYRNAVEQILKYCLSFCIRCYVVARHREFVDVNYTTLIPLP